VEVLGNSKDILKMTSAVDKLDDVEDSKMLGDLMIANGLILKMEQVLGEEAPSGGGGCCGAGPISNKK
jgi:hypothetical protein